MLGFLRGFDRLVIVLGIGQMTGWGTTYFLPGVLGEAFGQATGLSKPVLFSGITVMLLVASSISASAGRIMDERGSRLSMCFCSSMLALGLVVLSQVHGPVAYFVAWAIFGIAMPFGLGGGIAATLVELRGHGARRSLSYVLMVLSFSQAIFWPLTVWLDGQLGWRSTCMIFALMNLLVAIAYALVIRKSADASKSKEEAPTAPFEALAPDQRRRGMILLAIAFASNGFVTWGIELHALDILMSFGVGQALALSIITLRGPMTLIGRSVDLLLGGRISPLAIGIGASSLIVLAQSLPPLIGGALGAVLFVSLFAAGVGSFGIARTTIQLSLFGPAGFATLAGRIGQPVAFVLAIAPPVFGFVIEQFGARVATTIAVLCCMVSIAALYELRRMTRPL